MSSISYMMSKRHSKETGSTKLRGQMHGIKRHTGTFSSLRASDVLLKLFLDCVYSAPRNNVQTSLTFSVQISGVQAVLLRTCCSIISVDTIGLGSFRQRPSIIHRKTHRGCRIPEALIRHIARIQTKTWITGMGRWAEWIVKHKG